MSDFHQLGMDKNTVRKAIIKFRFICCLCCAVWWCPLVIAAEPVATTLDKLRALDESTRGTLGVYVKNFSTGEEIDYQAERKWYLASLVKIPLAIAVLQAVEKKDLALDDEIELQQTDLSAGSSKVPPAKPGARYSIGKLLQQSLEEGDSTATDMLMGKLGVANFNRQMRRDLGAPEFGTLRAMGALMERLGRGELLNSKHTDLLLSYLEKATGAEPPRAGSPLDRTCNLGITNTRDLGKSVVVVVCAEGFEKLEHAQHSFTSIAGILVADGRIP
ncbi:MAG: class A beta-lactamase-related serine hydrolase [Cellvibrionaceae bacterium]|nr:class A beta-lactamase-related serine hydrolase [Cellvibrionaceae bacterium]